VGIVTPLHLVSMRLQASVTASSVDSRWRMADGLRAIVARSCYCHGVFPECQATVKHDTESLHVVGHRQIDAGNRYRRHGRSNGVQLIRSADDQCFRLVRVQLKSVLHVLLLDVSSTHSEKPVCLCVCLDVSVYVCLSVSVCLGRTHQLRVHCCAVGHRVIGDFMYSGREDVSPHRMMLHAISLVIPMKHEHIAVTAADPFITELDTRWRTSRVFSTYDDFCRSQHV